MSSTVLRAWLLIGLMGIVLSGCAPREQHLVPLPDRVLNVLSLKPRERPREYVPVTDTNLLHQAGILQNPGYLQCAADRDMLIKIDADASFVAVYGQPDEVLLILKGTFFSNDQAAETYLDVQSTRQRQVMAFRRPIAGAGSWLLFAACDPDHAYTDDERASIRNGLERYRKRLGLELVFDHLKGSGE